MNTPLLRVNQLQTLFTIRFFRFNCNNFIKLHCELPTRELLRHKQKATINAINASRIVMPAFVLLWGCVGVLVGCYWYECWLVAGGWWLVAPIGVALNALTYEWVRIRNEFDTPLCIKLTKTPCGVKWHLRSYHEQHWTGSRQRTTVPSHNNNNR